MNWPGKRSYTCGSANAFASAVLRKTTMSSAVLPFRPPQSSQEQSVSTRRWLPTTCVTWVVIALALVAALSLLLPIQPEDFWWNTAIGRITWQTGRLPGADPFSYTQAGEPFFVHGWLPQVVFYLLYTTGGATLILLVQAAVLTGTYGLLLLLCVRRGA